MKRAIPLAAVAAAVVLSLAAAASAGSATVRVYFLSGAGRTLVAVERQIPTDSAQGVAAALVAGPTRSERAGGARSAVPNRVRLTHVEVSRARAVVNMRGAVLLRLRTIPRLRVIAALTYSLSNVQGIRSVEFSVDGKPWGVYDMRGALIRSYTPTSLRPGTAACAPADGCFTP